MKRETLKTIWQMGWKITLGSAIFALGFDLFLEPNNLNVGGMSGLAMVLRELLGLRPDRRDHHAFERTAVCPRRKEAWQKISVRFAVRDAAELRIHRSVRLYPRAENGNSARQPLWRHSCRAWHRPCVPVRGLDGRLQSSQPDCCAAASARPVSARSCWRSTCSSSR